MGELKRISSKCGNRFIDVVETEDGSYLLHKFARKYDSEEDKYYEIRELPDPGGRYGKLNAAISEGKRVLEN